MKRFALATTALLTLAAAAPAFANDQLAESLGVAGKGFSQSQLVQLKAAQDAGDAARINFLLKSGGSDGATYSTMNSANEGQDQLASSLGVNAADYSRSQLVELKAAYDTDGSAAQINAVLNQSAQ